MSAEIVPIGGRSTAPAVGASSLPVPSNDPVPPVASPGGIFSYAEHPNPHAQAAYLGAVKRFSAWAEDEGVELPPA